MVGGSSRVSLTKKSLLLAFLSLLVLLQLGVAPAYAQFVDPQDFADMPPPPTPGSVEELLMEAQGLFFKGKPIDARAKLQKALRKAPKDYRPHMMLGTYYLSEVGHFRLANRYLLHAERLFIDQYKPDTASKYSNPMVWAEYGKLLFLLSESRLNLDNYEGALETLAEYEKRGHWEGWLPGTKAWVLWKIGKTKEAIEEAQTGLKKGASAGKTYNILGILFSSINERERALQAYGNAIRSEQMLGDYGMIATPLNNGGEVYREMFKDGQAEASWIKALTYPDGCEHILPSLNLAVTYIEDLRLFKAERALKDFEACYAANSEKEDSEHKGLLSLARGRIALRKGELDKAVTLLEKTAASTQWFGRIGTNENDFRFATTIALANAYNSKAESLDDFESTGVRGSIGHSVEQKRLRLKAWWLMRRAREIALDELNDFEDLWIRHTDAMIEYPSLGEMTAGFPRRTFEARIERIKKQDDRKDAHTWYDLYQAENLLASGKYSKALTKLESVVSKLRPRDRLARAQAITKILIAKKKSRYFWQTEGADEEALKQQLFASLPSQLRYYDLALPVSAKIAANDSGLKRTLGKLSKKLLKGRFEQAKQSTRYQLILGQGDGEGKVVNLQLFDEKIGRALATSSAKIGEKNWESKLINQFIAKTFSHRLDPDGESLPKLELME